MRKNTAASRTSARAGTGASTTTRSTTPRKAKTAAASRTTARSTSAGTKRATAATKRNTTTAKTSTTRAATAKRNTAPKMEATARRGQPVRAREVGGTPWAELKQSLTTAFETAFADRKGQARGAAMRAPNRIIAELDKFITAIQRQTTNRHAQVQKLTQELATLREQPQASTQQQDTGESWPTSVTRTERTVPDQIAGQNAGMPLGAPLAQEPNEAGSGDEPAMNTRQTGRRTRTAHPASAE